MYPLVSDYQAHPPSPELYFVKTNPRVKVQFLSQIFGKNNLVEGFGLIDSSVSGPNPLSTKEAKVIFSLPEQIDKITYCSSKF